MTLTFGSLFAGCGGMDLGLEKAGLRCIWQVEIDGYARRVLAKHWPDVRRHDDVRTFPPGDPGEWRCDVICGGFPCQDISPAGRRAGIGGSRSGLWTEYARAVRVLRPGIVIVENSSALLGRGMDRVLGDLAACGYDAEWDCLPAIAFGAPHLRDRAFILAWDADRYRPRHGPFSAFQAWPEGHAWRDRWRACAYPDRLGGEAGVRRERREVPTLSGTRWGVDKPGLARASDGTPHRYDRIRCIGNAVVPQVAEFLGRIVLAWLAEFSAEAMTPRVGG